MTAKKDESAEVPAAPEVDMERIKAMMGPLPFETIASNIGKKKKGKDKLFGASSTLNAAAEEANAALKAMSADMGKASITKVEDDTPEPTGEDAMPQALLDDLTNNKSDEESEPEELPPVKEDEATAEAVDDILSHEADTVLEAEDEKTQPPVAVSKTLPKTKLSDRIKELWAKRYVRVGLIAGIVIALIAAALVPTSRYFVLNTAGARSGINLTVIDSSTLQPLKNVTVAVAGTSVTTDSSGLAKLEHVKLGPAHLTISKRAFTTIEKDVVLGWGSNPQGQFRLVASGAKYTFIVTDFLSGKPIEKAEALSGDGNAISDKNGKLVLALETSNKADTDEISIKVTAANYREEEIKITANNKETGTVKMVSSRKAVFISKRTGKYDVYSIDVDGKNEAKIVSGTGIERDDAVLAPQQNSDIAAYVATRENVKNSDGYLLSTLYLLDTKSGNLTKVDQSEQIRLVGWSSDQHLVYVKVAAGASAANSKRQRLVSVSGKDSANKVELASSNAFNDALMAGDKVLYAPSNSFQENPKPGLFMVGADNTALMTITNKEVFNIFRTNYETVVFDAGGAYFSYKIGAAPATVSSSSAPTTLNRLYIDNLSSNRSLWFDDRDGKGVIVSYDKTAKKDTVVVSQAGLKVPFYWLNDSVVVYRVNDSRETADYVVSVNGGTPKKIQDVTDAGGVGRWFYY